MMTGFEMATCMSGDVAIRYAIAGSGPAVLLLHGFPQTHAMWHAVGPALARHFTVIAPDLRGYGSSGKPEGTPSYSFRHMARDQIALLDHLGIAQCHVVGHDRGGRVAHRLALDAGDRVSSLTVMDIVPTHHLLANLTQQVAAAYYHWFFLAQPYPFPENMIAHDPDTYFESCLLGWGAAQLEDFDPDALAAYRTAWRDRDAIRGMCADYRAALQVDFDLDAADIDQIIPCPSLVLYGAAGAMAKVYDVPATWQKHLSQMTYAPIPGGHFFVDQHPEKTTDVLLDFLRRQT